MAFLCMDWVAKSYFGRATKEVVIEEFLRVLCFGSRLVGFRANFVQHVIYGYLTWNNSMTGFLSMDWVAEIYVGRATKEVVTEEFLRVLCF